MPGEADPHLVLGGSVPDRDAGLLCCCSEPHALGFRSLHGPRSLQSHALRAVQDGSDLLHRSGYGGGGAPPALLLPTEEAPHPPPPQPLRAPLLRLRATHQGLESSQRMWVLWVLSGDLLLAHSRYTVNICGFTPSGFWR